MAFLGTDVRADRPGLMHDLLDREPLDALALTTTDFFQLATNFNTGVQTRERPVTDLEQ